MCDNISNAFQHMFPCYGSFSWYWPIFITNVSPIAFLALHIEEHKMLLPIFVSLDSQYMSAGSNSAGTVEWKCVNDCSFISSAVPDLRYWVINITKVYVRKKNTSITVNDC